jgi:hypothetical protein
MQEVGSKSGNTGYMAPTIIEKVSTKSALSPLIWLAAALLTFTLGAAFVDKSLMNWLLLATFGVILLIAGCYIYLMMKKPHLLGSEEHQLKMHQLLGDERNGSNVTIDVTPTANNHIATSSP